MNTRLTFLTVALLSASSLHAQSLEIVSSFSILGDVAKQIGGERVSVSNLVPADGDAHAYQLTSGDIRKITSAKLILINGLGLESGDVVRAVQQSKVPYAEATKGIEPLKNDENAHHHHHDEAGHAHTTTTANLTHMFGTTLC